MIKHFIPVFFLSGYLAACVVAPTPTPVTPIVVTTMPNATSTSTREVTEVDQCAQQAITQFDINKCAAKKRDEAARQLEETIKQVQSQYSSATRDVYLTEVFPQATVTPPETFLQLQTDWKAWAERECIFRYGRIISDTTGFQYENGSMAPMLVASCETAKYTQRIDELRRLYLNKQ